MGFAAGCRDRCDPAQRGKRCFGAYPIGGDKQLGGGLVSDTVEGKQLRAGPFVEGPQLGVIGSNLGGQGLVARRRGTQRDTNSGLRVAEVTWVAGVRRRPRRVPACGRASQRAR